MGGLVRGYTRHLTSASPGMGRTDPLDRGLVGEWRFDPVTGLVVPDYSGHGNVGQLVGDVAWVRTEYGTGLTLDGVGDYVDIPSAPYWNFGVSSFTVELFFKYSTADDDETVIGTGAGKEDAGEWSLQTEGAGLRLAADADAWSIFWANASTEDGNWHHIVLIREGADRRLYKDGVFEADTGTEGVFNAATTVPGVAGDLRILGGYVGAIAALLDVARVYSRALTAAEVYARREECLKRAQSMARVWMIPWGKVPVSVGLSIPVAMRYYRNTREA